MAVYKYKYFPDIHEGFDVLRKKVNLERVDRPKALVNFSYKRIITDPIWCLLDSGADKILLNNEFAEFLNIDLSKAPEFKTQVVGGGIIKIKRHPIGVLFEGRRFNLECDFSDTHDFPLLGRTFFESFESVNFREPEKIVELILPTKSN
ncbi:MAG: hypothetical protein HY430_02785 [Candidatus Levybacteria bacterium]|nr:hypothetical protein [Candidatus Levybacteria bacterium]